MAPMVVPLQAPIHINSSFRRRPRHETRPSCSDTRGAVQQRAIFVGCMSLTAECDHRVDARRAPGGNQRGQQRNHHESERRGGKRRRIRGLTWNSNPRIHRVSAMPPASPSTLPIATSDPATTKTFQKMVL